MEQILYTTIDRILYYVESQGMSVRAFAKSVGISHSLLGKTKALGSDKLEKILSTYPDLNPAWLLTGKGEMLEKNSEDFNSPKITAQNNSSKADFNSPKQQPKDFGTDSAKAGESAPPENVFSGLTQEEVNEELRAGIREHLLDMFESGRAYPAAIVRQFQEHINELTAQVARLEYKNAELLAELAALKGKTGVSEVAKTDEDVPAVK